MKENKKNNSSIYADNNIDMNNKFTKEDEISEIIQMAMNDIEDLCEHFKNIKHFEDPEDYDTSSVTGDPLDAEFDKYFMPLFNQNNNGHKILIH